MERSGVCCRTLTGSGTRRINALPAGVTTGYGNGCWSTLLTTQIWKTDSWTVPSFGRIPARQELKKNGSQAEQALGRSRGGFSTKIHITVDGLGNPLRLRLTGGQRHDITQAPGLIDGFQFEHVIADRSYGAQDFIALVVKSGAEVVIPPRQNAHQPRDYDHWLYRERHLIECFINKIKHFRRVFSRFDKLARRYLGFLQLTSTLVWLR